MDIGRSSRSADAWCGRRWAPRAGERVSRWVGSSGLPSPATRPGVLILSCLDGPSVRVCPTAEHSDRLLTYGQLAPAGRRRRKCVPRRLAGISLINISWRRRRANGAQNALYSNDGNGGSFRRRSLGAAGQSLRGANVDIRRKCHGGRYHATTVPSLTAVTAAAAAIAQWMTSLDDRSLNYYSLKMLRRGSLHPLCLNQPMLTKISYHTPVDTKKKRNNSIIIFIYQYVAEVDNNTITKKT